MNSVDITNILRDNIVTKKCFYGVCASDQMIKTRKRPYCFIANTDPAGENGEHCTCWFITKKNVVYFLASFGRSPYSTLFPVSFREFINKRRFKYNPRVLQPLNGVTCGQYCIFAIFYLCLNVDLKSIYDYFTDDLHYNDDIVLQFINQIYLCVFY